MPNSSDATSTLRTPSPKEDEKTYNAQVQIATSQISASISDATCLGNACTLITVSALLFLFSVIYSQRNDLLRFGAI